MTFYPGGGSGGGLQPWQFAVGASNGTDDTPAFKTAMASAYNYIASNAVPYAEIVLNAQNYILAGAVSTGTLGVSGKCLAQVPLPNPAQTGQKYIIAIRPAGIADASTLYYFNSTTAQPCIIKSTLNASGSFGAVGTEPSVIGGPIPGSGYGAGSSTFANMMVVLDGVSIQVPNNPNICGIDLRGVAQANVSHCGITVNAAGPGAITVPTNGQQFGLAMPQANNNDKSFVLDWSAQGQNYGLVASEHTQVKGAQLINCIAGLCCAGGGATSTPHWMEGEYISIEACQLSVQGNYDTANPTKIRLHDVDIEGGSGGFSTTAHVYDPNNNLFGEIVLNYNGVGSYGSLLINGGSQVRIVQGPMAHGPVSSPHAAPGSASAWLNAYNLDAEVTCSVSGGTLSAMTITGPAGAISQTVPGSTTFYRFTLPAGCSYTPTYTGTLTHTVSLFAGGA